MICSIKDFSDSQIEKLRQCPGVKIDMDEGVAEVPFMAEGFYSALAGKKKQRESQINKNPSQPFDKLLKDPGADRLNNKELKEGVQLDTNINGVAEGATKVSPDCNTLGDDKGSEDSEEEKQSFYKSASDAIESHKKHK